MNFAKMWKISAIHIQVENMTALSYMLKNGREKISRTNADLKENLGVSTWAGG